MAESTQHPDDETLSAYLSAALGDFDRQRVGQHLETCEGCTRLLAVAHRRVALATDAREPLPAEVAARAQEAAGLAGALDGTAARPDRRGRERSTWSERWEAWRGRLADWFSLPVLVPVAAAAVALFVVVSRVPPPGGELGRGPAVRQTLRISVAEAVARESPELGARQLAILRRGDRVEILEERRGWYRAKLASGDEVWVESRAFE